MRTPLAQTSLDYDKAKLVLTRLDRRCRSFRRGGLSLSSVSIWRSAHFDNQLFGSSSSSAQCQCRLPSARLPSLSPPGMPPSQLQADGDAPAPQILTLRRDDNSGYGKWAWPVLRGTSRTGSACKAKQSKAKKRPRCPPLCSRCPRWESWRHRQSSRTSQSHPPKQELQK